MPSPQGKLAPWCALGVVLVAGMVLRGVYLSELAENPEFVAPGVDAGFHDYWARALVTGDWTPPPGEADPEIRTRPYLRPPGYPYFLALVYSVAGLEYWAPRAVQMAANGAMNKPKVGSRTPARATSA